MIWAELQGPLVLFLAGVVATANVGIFFRLGGLVQAAKDHDRRITKIEECKRCLTGFLSG